jgi:hypothetical protein
MHKLTVRLVGCLMVTMVVRHEHIDMDPGDHWRKETE